jgi:uncharacterized protein (TIGR00159 family)
MAVGLLVVFVVYQVTRWLELITLYSLLHTFLSSIVILAVIVFQDDIRRALFRVGRFAKFSHAQEAATVDEVIKGATSLADKRIGALIIFEREARLDDFIEAGTDLDAAVSGDLLYAIFIPAFQNPVHDGAVIVRNFRIHKAGAFLPLTRNPNIEKTLGTRHRAGLGITEETDALAVVVSEERGTMSLCQEGRIEMGLDPDQLREALLAQFSKPRRPIRLKTQTSSSDPKTIEDREKIQESVSKDRTDDHKRSSTWPEKDKRKSERSVQRRVAIADSEE